MCCISPAPSFEGRNTNLSLSWRAAAAAKTENSGAHIWFYFQVTSVPVVRGLAFLSPRPHFSTKTLGEIVDQRSAIPNWEQVTGTPWGVECSCPSSWNLSLGTLQRVIQDVFFFFLLKLLRKLSSGCSVSISKPHLLISGHRNVLSLAQAKTGQVWGFWDLIRKEKKKN